MAKAASSDVITLPKGGGALHGIGEKFSPDLHTGTGNFTVPIALPPGRNGFQPQLNLVYSTGNGNGPFGLGWSLSVPGVSRKTSKGVPRYRDDAKEREKLDTFILSGAEDLVRLSRDSQGTDDVTRYRPRTEGLVARIYRCRKGGSDYWKVESKDGLISYYGTPKPENAGATWRDPGIVFDPEKASRTFAWKLTLTEDPFGNRIEYEYERDSGLDGPHHWDQLYLKQINYADYSTDQNRGFLVTVAFRYEDRPDPFSEYRSGFEIRTRRRCTRIEIRTHAEADEIVRTYHLRYLDEHPVPPDGALPLNKASLLHQISVEGRHNGTEDTTENLLSNPDFAVPHPEGSSPPLTGPGRPIPSAAANWSVWNNSDATTTTELLDSDFQGGTKRIIRVITNGPQSGLVQTFLPTNAGPPYAVAGAWVRVRRGKVGIGTGNGGYRDVDVVSSKRDEWEYLQAQNGRSPANEFIIYSTSAGGAEFDVALASVVPRSDWLPPLEFNYTRFEPTKRRYAPLSGRDLPARSLGNPDLELVDLFGNGLPDILEMNGTVRYWRNLGGGKFDLPRMMSDVPAGLALADAGVQLVDANGDGRTDLLVTKPELAGYYSLRFDGRWDRKSFQRYEQAPSFSFEDPEVRLIDLDGDGVTDAIRSSTRLECFFNDPEQGWLPENVTPVPRRHLEEFPDVNFSDVRVKWADMTGDGLHDIVLIHNGRIDYWPNLGHGEWGKRITMHTSPRFEDAGVYGAIGYDPRRILIGDVDGDGVADLVYVASGHITVWINRSGNGWSDAIRINGMPPVTDLDAVRLADMYGTGTAGILWTSDYGVYRDSAYKFLDLTGGVKPYLLNEMDNHIGAITKVEYASSTQFYLQDQRNREPKKRWETPLPFPVQVVSRVEVIDELSKGRLTTEYRYHHGYWDGAEREFRGFGMVKQLDTESFGDQEKAGMQGASSFFRMVDQKYFSPPLLTKTWFHQGPVGEESGDWQELDWAGEYWSGDSQLLKHTETVNEFIKGLIERRTKRDALRALRGSILRTELYALDGPPLEDKPYTVTEYSYGLREVDPPVSGEKNRLRIFFPYQSSQRTTQWERGGEPMTQFTFSRYTEEDGSLDSFGRLLAQTQIACPRGWRALADTTDAFLATRTVNDYAEPLKPDKVYIHDRVARLTRYEITNTVPRTVSQIQYLPDNDPALRIIGQTLNFYDGDALDGRPFGQVEEYGALVRTENLMFTDEILRDASRSGEEVQSPPELPPYLTRSGSPKWNDYPQDFRDKLPEKAGYLFQNEAPYATGYFAATERRRYDFHGAIGTKRGLVIAKLDALGNETSIEYDHPYRLLPTKVTDPAGLTTAAEYDYRVLQPRQVTDPNGNKSAYSYTRLGLLKTIMIWGEDSTAYRGDRTRPSVSMGYDFLAFDHWRQPISVRTLRHVHHDQDSDVPVPERDEIIETREYSDGFGRLLQTRTQGEEVRFGHAVFGGDVLPPDQADEAATKREVKSEQNTRYAKPNVVVSGWQRYDNKGRVVEKYEPFFSEGWEYAQPDDAQNGQKARMFYDSRGRVFRTVNPDDSEQRVVFGVPGTKAEPDLTDPNIFEPTPWETYTYDANDNAGRTHGSDPTTQRYRHHWDTPTSIVIDALGRTIETVERDRDEPAGPSAPLPPIKEYRTRMSYDIRGNLLTVTDPLGRVAFAHVYDLANRPWRVKSIDAGVKRTVLDAAGNVVEQRDSKGALILHAYDKLNRLTHLWAQDGAGPKVTLREKLIYGDDPHVGLTENQVKAGNLKGKLYQHYDEAGRLTFIAYDFKGNLLEKTRQVIADSAIDRGAGSVETFVVNWDTPPALEGDYRTSMSYDALNRIKTLTYPQDVDGERKILRPRYNRAGALERVTLNGETYVEHIAYNAKGQRTLIAYGNEVMTRYAYDPKTFRLVRLRTERHQKTIPTVNLARVTKGVTASASSTYAGANPPSAVIDGNRAGSLFPPYWADNTRYEYPDWIEVDFDGPKTINAINVFTTQDAPLDGTGPAVEPTEDMTFSKFGIRDFEVQYWAGAEWVTIPGGNVTGNDKVWRRFTFPDVTADRIRVLIHRAGLRFSPVAEIEAFETGTGTNVALAANGAGARASSVLEPWPPRMVMDGDRKVYQWKGQAHYPAWLQIDFGGPKTVEEIDLFFHQEVDRPMVDPTTNPDLTSRYVMTDFEVQYWTGADWATVPGGSVTGNDKVWRKFNFPAIATDKIRVFMHKGPLTGDVPAIIEVEAYGPGGVEFKPQGAPLQDFAYSYDLAGNILKIQDRTPESGIPNTVLGIDALDREFGYDPLYRLLSATGRQHDAPPPQSMWEDRIVPTDPTRTQTYRQDYSYDKAGNLTELQHQSPAGDYTKHFELMAEPGQNVPKNNRLSSVTVGQISYGYEYDENGNMRQETASRHFEWDHSDRLRVFRNQTSDSTPSVHARYLYDAGGQRAKKLVRKGAIDVEVTVYIDGVFEHHRRLKKANGRVQVEQENNTLHVMDNQHRIALLRVGKAFSEDGAADKPVQYHLGDHLGSSHIVIGGATAAGAHEFVNREEYFPYGETSFGSFARKRYRYTAKERDEESGLYYHGARYYAPWLARWVSCDPAGRVDGLNLHAFVKNNTINLVDNNGKQVEPMVNGANAEADLAKIARDTAGFAQGRDTPPEFKSSQGSPFGTKAHNNQLKPVIDQMKAAGYKGAERMHEGVRVDMKTGSVVGINMKPGGKDTLNFDMVFSEAGTEPKSLNEILTTVDVKYGRETVNMKQANAGPKHIIVGDRVRTFVGTTGTTGIEAGPGMPDIGMRAFEGFHLLLGGAADVYAATKARTPGEATFRATTASFQLLGANLYLAGWAVGSAEVMAAGVAVAGPAGFISGVVGQYEISMAVGERMNKELNECNGSQGCERAVRERTIPGYGLGSKY